MSDCVFVSGSDGWVCTQCGYQYVGSARPRRNCKPREPLPPRDVTNDLESFIEQSHATGRLGVPLVEVEGRLAVCRGCEAFRETGCTRYGEGCEGRTRWRTALAAETRGFGPIVPACEKWPAVH